MSNCKVVTGKKSLAVCRTQELWLGVVVFLFCLKYWSLHLPAMDADPVT